MAKTIDLEVITPSGTFYKGAVNIVICNTALGEEGFMANHAWACKILVPGKLWIKEQEGGEFRCAVISGGFVDVKETVHLFADSAEWLEEIDLEGAEAAKEAAEKILKNEDKTRTSAELNRAEKDLAIAKARIKAAKDGGKRK